MGRVSEEEAEAKSRNVDYLLMRIKQGLIEVPAGMPVAMFVRFDGKPPSRESSAPVQKVRRDSGVTTLDKLRDKYLAAHASALEVSTFKLTKTHFKHLTKTLGE